MQRAAKDESRLTSVDDIMAVEVCQPMKDTFGNFAQDFLPGSATELLHFLVHAVETLTFTEFHSYGDGTRGFVHECTIVLANVFGRAFFVELEFSQNLFLDIWVGACGYDLEHRLV